MKDRKAAGLSRPLMAELFRLYWYLPVLTFLFYFILIILPCLMEPVSDVAYEGAPVARNLLVDCLGYNAYALPLLILLVPLILSITMMGFMHRSNRALFLHAQPFSRNRLFATHMLTGWLMGVLPILAMGLCFALLWAVKRNLFLAAIQYMGASGALEVIGHWMLVGISAFTFFYGLYALAGSLTGTSVFHLLLSALFFCLVPLVSWIIASFCETFLPGYAGPGPVVEELIMGSNPLIYILNEYDLPEMSYLRLVIYLLLGAAFLLLGGFLYRRAKLEHIGDATLYGAFGEIATWLLTFIGMTALGTVFYVINESRAFLLVGMAFGAILTFAIVKIVLTRSIRIFSKSNLRSLLLFAVLAVLFTGVSVFDVTGFARRVPEVSQVESVSREIVGPRCFYGTYEGNEKGNSDDLVLPWDEPENLVFTDPDTIRQAVAIHQYVVDQRLYDQENIGNVENATYAPLNLNYQVTGGSRRRHFDLRADETLLDMLRALGRSPEVRQKENPFSYLPADDVSFVQIRIEGPGLDDDTAPPDALDGGTFTYQVDEYASRMIILLDRRDDASDRALGDLLTAMTQDFSDRIYLGSATYQTATAETESHAYVEIELVGSMRADNRLMDAHLDIPIDSQCSRTRAVLLDYMRTNFAGNPGIDTLVGTLESESDADVF